MRATGAGRPARARFASALRAAFGQGWVPTTGAGVRPTAPLADLPAGDREVLDAGAGRRVALVRSPEPGVALHELAALSVLSTDGRRRVGLTDVAAWSQGRREQARASRSTHRIACGTGRHVLRVDDAGPVAVSHPELDVDSERVAVALGMPASACLQVLLDWPDPARRLPDRLEAARTLHRLSAWAGSGASAAETDVALAAWLTPDQVRRWQEHGVGLLDAAVWVWHGVSGPAELDTWRDLGCDPSEARAVLDAGVDPRALTAWVDAGVAPAAAALLVRGGAPSPDRLPRRRGEPPLRATPRRPTRAGGGGQPPPAVG